MDARKLAFNFTPQYKTNMKTIKEENGLGTTQVPAGYGAPDFSVGDGTNPGPNPDATLAADTAAAMSSGEENPGFSLGGADDPLNEYEAAGELSGALLDNPNTTTINDPSFGMSSVPPVNESEDEIMHEDDVAYDASGNVIDDFTGDAMTEDDDVVTFDSVDEMPEFEEYDELDVANEDVDGAGIIEPEVIDVTVEDPELGAVPDVELPMTEPIVQVEEDEPDVYATEAEIEGTEPAPIISEKYFRLPEDRSVVVAKGDQIFVIGHAMNENTPKFTESVFKRAFRSLVESKNIQGKLVFKKSEGLKKCALVGRSVLVEIAKDWRIPGTDIVLEAHDIVQIVSMKPITEKTVAKKEQEKEPAKSETEDKTSEETEEEKKAKKEFFLAQKRYLEAKARREAAAKKNEEDDGKKSEEEDKKSETEDKKSEEEDKSKKEDDKKKTEAYLRRNGIYF